MSIELTVQAFGQRNANLCTVDAALKFLYKNNFNNN